MTIFDYIRQLPGAINLYELIPGCPRHYGLDDTYQDDKCVGKDCSKCFYGDATIGGKPAPYLFSCPVKPGQTVYCVFKSGDISEDFIKSVSFICEDDGESYWECYGRNDYMIVNSAGWMTDCFPTREAAENQLAEICGKDGAART